MKPASGAEQEKLEAVFNRLSQALAGERSDIAITALQTLYAATICTVSDDVPAAIALAGELQGPLEARIRRRFEFWKSSEGHLDVGARQ